jgi:hypothetical protein
MKNITIKLLLLVAFFFTTFQGIQTCNAQDHSFPYDSFLNKQPYFATHKTLPTDSLFLQDLKVIKHFVQIDSIDVELLKPNILAALMLEQVNAGKAATFQVLINYFNEFKSTIAYKDFRKGVLLYRNMEGQTVNLSNWDVDKELFVKLGFTEADLEDFKDYIINRAPKNINYKEAYTGYMKEIAALK